MANRKFTEQEMLTLRNSKYVLDVSPSIVHFSAEFKKLFWEELSKGRLPREIISTLGIDPNILGDSRINGLKTMIGNEVKKGNVKEEILAQLIKKNREEILTTMQRAATDICRLKIG